ncbi:YcdB/YcdC domain-containing protein [Alicyclobacillus suci]|uniref:YcdB/YcdC domain-containing protein n=1 Tax=Alicyclobacillus suci TaxID=2816080 RepID=UPI001A8C4766|nr:YcdB/YcdC domain-containing protein [Alicyclobacillus suci]
MQYVHKRFHVVLLSSIVVLSTGLSTALAADNDGSASDNSPAATTSGSTSPKYSSDDAINIAKKLVPELFANNQNPTVSLGPNPTVKGQLDYQLNWSPVAMNNQPGPRLTNAYANIAIDANTGDVIQFNQDGSAWTDPTKTISGSAAQQKAENWLAKLTPTHYQDLSIQPGSGAENGGFVFLFVRKVNGIIAPFNQAVIHLDNLGNLIEYNLSWQDVQLPSVPSTLLTPADAATRYQNNLILSLQYQPQFTRNGAGPQQLVYAPTTSALNPLNPLPALDAVTGLPLDATGTPIPASSGNSTGITPEAPLVADGPHALPKASAKPYTTAQLQTQIAQQLGLAAPDWNISSGTGQSLSSSGEFAQHPIVDFNYVNSNTGKTLSVSVDATDGIITDYDSGGVVQPTATSAPQLSLQALQANANAAVEKLYPTLTGAFAIEPTSQANVMNGQVMFTYDLFINGIQIPALNVVLNAFTGELENANLSVDPSASFPSPANAISVSDAKADFLKQDPVELQYFLPIVKNASGDQQYPLQYADQAKLVYAPAPLPDETGILDALTGKLIPANNGLLSTPVNLPKNATPAQVAITKLQANGFLPSGTIDPKATISRAEFIAWLSNAYQYDISGSPAPQFPDVSADNPYATNISEALMQGWLPGNGDLSPASALTRLAAANWLVDWLGWQGPAAHPSLFKLNYKDVSAVPKADEGAVAMISGAGIIPLVDGKFNPNQTMTQGDAAIALVNAINTFLAGQQG